MSFGNTDDISVHARRGGLYDAYILNDTYIRSFTSLNEDGPFRCIDKDARLRERHGGKNIFLHFETLRLEAVDK